MWRADIEVPNTTVYVNYWVVSACYPRGNFYPLSDDHSILNRLITKSCFRTCSTCWSRSQAPYIPLRSLNDFRPFWGNLWTPPLLFRRRPPQSNCPPDTVPVPDNGTRLEIQLIKGCLLYTSDAADEEDSVDIGGPGINKKKKEKIQYYIPEPLQANK